MALRRMIARNVAISKKLSTVSWFEESLWHRGIPFCDDAGFMERNAEEVRALLLPMGKGGKQIPQAKVEQALEALEVATLIEVYTCPHRCCLRYVNFEKFQTLKPKRPLQIECVNPDGVTCFPLESIGILWNPEESKFFLVRGRGSEVKGSEVKRREVKAAGETPSPHKCGKPETPAPLKTPPSDATPDGPEEWDRRKKAMDDLMNGNG